jgi:hypothetical protein
VSYGPGNMVISTVLHMICRFDVTVSDVNIMLFISSAAVVTMSLQTSAVLSVKVLLRLPVPLAAVISSSTPVP